MFFLLSTTGLCFCLHSVTGFQHNGWKCELTALRWHWDLIFVQALKDSYLLSVSFTCKMNVLILSWMISSGNTADILMKDNFHSGFMEDKQALDPFSPMHKSAGQQQRWQCITHWFYWLSLSWCNILDSCSISWNPEQCAQCSWSLATQASPAQAC